MAKIYIKRVIRPLLLKALDQFPVLSITGPRQSGKSTLLKKLLPNFHYVTLDDPILRQKCIEDPGLFISSHRPPLIIDEIQYAPELLPYIKMNVDENRANGMYALTGSQMFPLMSGLTESLAGRVAIFELLGFSNEEMQIPMTAGVNFLFNSFIHGAFPEAALKNVDADLFYPSYLQTYLERDIRQIINVQDMRQYQQFLEVLASRVGSILNLSEIGKVVGVSHTTAKKWLSLLESTRLIYLLPPYFKNVTRRVIKSPKLYFTDLGLLSYILRYKTGETLAAGPMAGHFFENYMIIELLKYKLNHNLHCDLYFYRDTNKNEIDLLIDYNNQLRLIEIKKKESIAKKDGASLNLDEKQFLNAKKYLISFNSSIKMLSSDIQNLHWSEYKKLF